MNKDKKIRMIKVPEIYSAGTLYEISNLDYWFVGGSGAVIKDGGYYKATIYEFGDTPMYSAWEDTPRKAVNAALKQFDMKLGMESGVVA